MYDYAEQMRKNNMPIMSMRIHCNKLIQFSEENSCIERKLTDSDTAYAMRDLLQNHPNIYVIRHSEVE
jgi:hypothetical protein